MKILIADFQNSIDMHHAGDGLRQTPQYLARTFERTLDMTEFQANTCRLSFFISMIYVPGLESADEYK